MTSAIKMQTSSLFEQDLNQPLAAQMRPKSLDDYFGQQQVVGPGSPLRVALEKQQAHSMIIWGPPGTGKTTLAELVASSLDIPIARVSAVTSGVKDIRAAIDDAQMYRAQYGKPTLLFVDEVHRFNKSQQDAFLPFVENGTVIFVGATTENPSFSLNNALLSRARVYVLNSLSMDDLMSILEKALLRNQTQIDISSDAKQMLCQSANGDARKLLNQLEICLQQSDTNTISISLVEQVAKSQVGSFDNQGDEYFDTLSAFHKSVRGSSPDGALYWYARFISSGGDAQVIARRLLAIASEDIGNADPRAMQLCLNAWDTYHRVGKAEGERAIAQATLYCAAAAKSNATYVAFKQALALAEQTSNLAVPNHLRNAPTSLAKSMGHGQDYRYAHEEDNAFAAGENYFPKELMDTVLYRPTARGLEKQIAEKLEHLRLLNTNSASKRYHEP